jgi:hypothetical protein
VWLVWLLIALAIGVYTFIAKDSTLLEKVLGWFFTLSMMYLGVNVGQKGALAFADALKNKYSTKEETEDE